MKTVVCIYLVFLTVFLYSWDLNKLDSQLFAYIDINDLDGVKSVVEQGANVNAEKHISMPGWGYTVTVLGEACRQGHLAIVQYLVENGADINLMDSQYNTPLILAAVEGHIDIITYLIKEGTEIDYASDEYSSGTGSALYEASSIGNEKAVAVLAKAGADVNYLFHNHDTPIEAATRKGYLPVVKILVEYGANKKKSIITAVSRGKMDIIAFLVKNNAPLNIFSPSDSSCKYQNFFPLMIAVHLSDIALVKAIIQKKADINIVNSSGHCAFSFVTSLDIAKHLINAGADLSIRNKDDYSLLHIACGKLNIDIVKILIENGLKVNDTAQGTNTTPLIEAVKTGNIEIVKYLLDNNADINLVDSQNKKALNYASDKKNNELIALLKSGSQFAGSGTINHIHTSGFLRMTGDYYKHHPIKAFDNNPKTAWIENGKGPGLGDYIQVYFRKPITVDTIEIMPGYFDSRHFKQNNRIKKCLIQLDEYKQMTVCPDAMTTHKIVFSVPRQCEMFKLCIYDVYQSKNDSTTALSEISFYFNEKKYELKLDAVQKQHIKIAENPAQGDTPLVSDSFFITFENEVNVNHNQKRKPSFKYYEDKIYCIAPTADNEYLTGGEGNWGEKKRYDLYSQAILQKLDKNGNREWRVVYDSEHADYINNIIQCKDNGFLIIGMSGGQMWVMKLDDDYQFLWQRHLGYNRCYSVTETSGEEYIISGKTHYYNTLSRPFLIKLSGSGDILWEKACVLYQNNYYESYTSGTFYDSKETKDNTIIAVGSVGLKDDETGYIVEVNTEGTILWQKYLPWKNIVLTHMLITDKNDYLLTGYKDKYTYVFKINHDGKIIWFYKINYSHYSTDSSKMITDRTAAVNIRQTQTGNYIIVCPSLEIYLLNGNGEELKQTRIDIKPYYQINAFDLELTRDGGCIITGIYKLKKTDEYRSFALKLNEQLEPPPPLKKNKAGIGTIFKNLDTLSLAGNSLMHFSLFQPKQEEFKHEYRLFIPGSIATLHDYDPSSPNGKTSAVTEQIIAAGIDEWDYFVLKEINFSYESVWSYKRNDKTSPHTIFTSPDNHFLIPCSKKYDLPLDDRYLEVKTQGTVMSIDDNGTTEWEAVCDGSHVYHGCNAHGSGNVIVGDISSFNTYGKDYWVAHFNNNGNVLWQKTYGGEMDEQANAICQTDTGYLIAGSSQSFGNGDSNIWIINIDKKGTILWQKLYEGCKEDTGYSIYRVNNNEYLVVGQSDSFNDYMKTWVLKIDNNGKIIFQRVYSGRLTRSFFDDRKQKLFLFDISSSDVLCLNTKGDIIWDKNYNIADLFISSNDESFSSCKIHDMDIYDEEYYVLTGIAEYRVKLEGFDDYYDHIKKEFYLRIDIQGNTFFTSIDSIKRESKATNIKAIDTDTRGIHQKLINNIKTIWNFY